MKRCQVAVDTYAEHMGLAKYPPVECRKPATHLAHQGDREWSCCDEHADEHRSDGLDVEVAS